MTLESHHEEFRSAVRRMALAHVAPIATELDRSDQFPVDMVEVFARMGLVQLSVPQEFGGPGGDLRSACVAREEVARAGSMALGSLVNQTGIVVQALLDSGSADLKSRILPALAEGTLLTCIAITEADGGSDPCGHENSRCAPRRRVGNYGGQAVHHVGGPCSLRIGVRPAPTTARGAPELAPSSSTPINPGGPSLHRTARWASTGSPTTASRSRRYGAARRTWWARRGRGFVRPPMRCTSTGRRWLRVPSARPKPPSTTPIAYLKERTVGGRPLAERQGLRWIMAEDATLITAARGLVYESASLWDRGGSEDEIAMASSMAKLFAADMVERVTSDALQLLGGHGYMQDHPVERYVRDARLVGIYEGTSQIQKEIISKRLVRADA